MCVPTNDMLLNSNRK